MCQRRGERLALKKFPSSNAREMQCYEGQPKEEMFAYGEVTRVWGAKNRVEIVRCVRRESKKISAEEISIK